MKAFRVSMLSKISKRFLLITVVLSISGCALTTGHVDLEYQPTSAGTNIATAASLPVAIKIIDKRPTQIVGSKINGFGMKTADIISDSDVPATLKSAFETELNNRGFRLGANGHLIVIELSNLQNQFAWNYFLGRVDRKHRDECKRRKARRLEYLRSIYNRTGSRLDGNSGYEYCAENSRCGYTERS
jgi:hypothetical protein